MTTSTQRKTQVDPPLSPRHTLPTMYELPSENLEEPRVVDQYHVWQPQLLESTFKPLTWPPEQVLIASELNLYYDVKNTQWYKRPDWYAVVGVPRFYEEKDLRLSYVMWQEGVSPFVVVELLSPVTEKEDLGKTNSQPGEPPTKWQVYEQILRIPYYFVFSRYSNEMKAFHLQGANYQAWEPEAGKWQIPQLGLSLGLWQGSYKGKERLWLRWYTLEGELIAIPEEEADEAKQEANQAKGRAEALAAKLRELGIDPDEIEI